MPRRVLCKFFAKGFCLKGEHCDFLHDLTFPLNNETVTKNVCTFYQRGACSYGSRCRYAHVESQAAPSSSTLQNVPSDSVQISHLPGLPLNEDDPAKLSAPGKPITPPSSAADGVIGSPTPISLADRPICSFTVDGTGTCPHGESCPKIHGDVCSICGKHSLHPYNPDERQEHIKHCETSHERLEVLRLSEEKECNVCLERVLSKPTPAERKFGLLSECDHAFCISCIRNWRGNSPSSGMDVNTALRACPVCRKLSYFVVPSVTWYSTIEEKQEIIDSYKAKLKSIDCKHFNFGYSRCPFGTSCFYKHTFKAHGFNPCMDRPGQFTAGEELADLLFEELLELSDEMEDVFEEDVFEDSDDDLDLAFMLMQLGAFNSSTYDDL